MSPRMSRSPGEQPADPGPILSLADASFGYGDKVVVAGVDLQVRRGEVVAVLGPNGSGKSTLVKGLLGLGAHLGGTVELFGTPLRSFNEFTRLGYVPQRHTLSTSVRATVAEVVATGRLPHQSWWSRPSRRDRALIDHSLELVGLEDRAREDVSTLSGGQQRRVLIARALAAEPDVLVMDEPTAGVDAASQQVLAEVLARLAGQGTTMLIVTHELEALRAIVSRIVLVGDGEVRFDGTPQGFATLQRRHLLVSAEHHHHHDDDLAPGESPVTLPAPVGPLEPRQEPER